jgi:hypothetical protein
MITSQSRSVLVPLLFVLFTKYDYNYQVEEEEVGMAHGTNGGEEEFV